MKLLTNQTDTPAWSDDLFSNPPAEFRAVPFWSWNCRLDKEVLRRQIQVFKVMGFGGFQMHSRTGLATPYLGDEFFDLIKLCVDLARENGLKAWLYDEDRWPSGFAGGLVTRNPRWRARHLRMTLQDLPAGTERRLLGYYRISLGQDGRLLDYCLADSGQWKAYLEIAGEEPWYNNQTYVNTLDKLAIDEFCRLTHEQYARHVGDDFGMTIPAIFTDEPMFTKKTNLAFAGDSNDIVMPWTDDLPETFQAAYGRDILKGLPELFWNLPEGQPSFIRYAYHAHISERFASAFADNLGQWCSRHGLLLAGHMMEEPTLKSQTVALGEVMRSLGSFQLPGVDILCDRREYTTVKQAQSVSRQYGRSGVLSELYGVTNWDFDFRGHKLQGDWQAALGVTVRTPHLSWVSMAGEAKRDYPASIGSQSPWHLRYPLIEDHFARVNVAMTRGKPLVRVGVIHPVESYWLEWGPEDQTAGTRDSLDQDFQNLTDWLLFGQIDFDLIAESLLPQQCAAGENPLVVGNMRYDVILLPGCTTIRRTTFDRLKSFKDAGGQLIFVGRTPALIEAVPDPAITALTGNAGVIPANRQQILAAMEPYRDLDIFRHDGRRADDLLCQFRQDGSSRWLFVAHGRKPVSNDERTGLPGRDVLPQENISVRINGIWSPTLYNTFTGEHQAISCTYRRTGTALAATEIGLTFFAHDSLLFHLLPGQQDQPAVSLEKPFTTYRLGRRSLTVQEPPSPFFQRVPVTLLEPNVLLLDMAEYALDDEAWHPFDEVLRLDNNLRQRLGMPPRQNAVAQPWTEPTEPAEHTVRLRFCIHSELDLDDISLALETAAETTVRLNGEVVESRITGHYVDEAIQTIRLPRMSKGENTLELGLPFGRQTHVEACYLLGDFGVHLQGIEAVLTAPVRSLCFGDIVHQGLPFYGGSLVYHLAVESAGENWTAHAPYYRGAMIDVAVDGRPAGSIIFAPYDCSLGELEPGRHAVDLTLYGTRANTFGAVHNCNENWWWFGPDAYRVYRDEWSYEYVLKPAGILKSPEIRAENNQAL